MMMMMNHKQRCWEVGLGPAGTAGPMVLIVSTNCKFFLFWLNYLFVNNVVGLVITRSVIGASPRRNGVHQRNWDCRNRSESEVRKGLGSEG